MRAKIAHIARRGHSIARQLALGDRLNQPRRQQRPNIRLVGGLRLPEPATGDFNEKGVLRGGHGAIILHGEVK